jgi:RNA polymerase sigma factor (sigma-70 family)
VTDKTLKGLFLSHRRELQAYLSYHVKDAEVAADLTQEAFLRYAEQDPVKRAMIFQARSYLFSTARNLAIDHLRRKARQKTDAMPHEDMAHVADTQPSPEEHALDRQRLERLYAIIGGLPERTRQVFVLTRIEGLTYVETAERLQISDSSVQKHLAKALLHITQRLKPQ